MSEWRWWRKLRGGTWYLQYNDIIGYWWSREKQQYPCCGWSLLRTEEYGRKRF